jgi:hypothetical protein
MGQPIRADAEGALVAGETISPPCGPISDRERASCQFRDVVGSCWSSVDTRP